MSPLSFVELSRSNLIHNYHVFRSFIHPKTKIICVVKGNAYGHGQNETVNILNDVVDCFQVDDIEELRLLRQISQKPVMVFGYVQKSELEEAVQLNATLGVYDRERLATLNQIGERLNRKIEIHLKIDAYLGRQGVLLDDLPQVIDFIKTLSHISITGVYSHFANIEDTPDFAHAAKQVQAYNQALKLFTDNGFTRPKTHISATSGVLAYEKDQGLSDYVRLGIGLYGMWPSESLKVQYPSFELRPVMRWVSHVAQVKTVPAGYPIGYGLTYITKQPTKVAIIPQGYSDGYDRGLSNKGHVLIQGQRCPVIGRVAMNMFAADVSKISRVEAEDEAVLLGSQLGETITAEELADELSTINYEITTRVSPLLPRIVA